jgi:Holliday junction resolvase RusA-like endonuclease
MQIVTLDWPAQTSSMNSRGHWREKGAYQKSQKHAAAMLCRHLPKCSGGGEIPLRVVFICPDRRRRDADNLLSSIKTALDAIATQIGVDDSRFWPVTLEKQYVGTPRVEVMLDYA